MRTINRRQHNDEFKCESVRLAKESGKPKAQIARELGIRDSLLHAWSRKADAAQDKGLTVEALRQEQKLLRALRRDVIRLKQENARLKKAAAYVCPLGALPRSRYEVRDDK